jgi:lipopolysaccharide O-acetyltransferase
MNFLPRSLAGRIVIWHGFWQRLCSHAFSGAIGGAFHEFGSQSVIVPPARLSGVGRISIGRGVYVGAGSWFNVVEPGRTGSPAIRIGEGTSIAGAIVLSAYDSILIEDHVLFARNVYISDHSHRFDDIGKPVLAQGIDHVAPIKIGRGSWICQNVVICPGVTIGRGAVVGANSVVKIDVPDYSLAAGAPCRVVRPIKNPA